MIKTVVIGASEKPERYSNMAVRLLKKYGHEVVAIGMKKGNIDEVEIITGLPELTDIHTVTMYVGPNNQHGFFNYILGLKPKRVIFNPGTENLELYELLDSSGIEVVEACTLVMLNTRMF